MTRITQSKCERERGGETRNATNQWFPRELFADGRNPAVQRASENDRWRFVCCIVGSRDGDVTFHKLSCHMPHEHVMHS